jgi:hypothetical protein
LQTEQEALNQKILGILSSLCQQLEIRTYSPKIISWVSVISGGRAMIEMPFDEVMLSKSQITMPAGMQTKLEPEEWRPILASALIMSKILRRKLLERVLIGLAALIAVSAVLFLTLPVLLPGLVTTCSKGGSCGDGSTLLRTAGQQI